MLRQYFFKRLLVAVPSLLIASVIVFSLARFIPGDVVTLTAGVGLAGYRVIQESLTNARKHAPGADVTVTVDYGTDELGIEIVNACPDPANGSTIATPSRPPDGSGFGLIAMRERVAAYHGSIEAGPDRDGMFRVRARIPYVDALADGKMSP